MKYRRENPEKSMHENQALSSARETSAEVGQCLRKLRQRRGLSIRTLAEQSGLNANTLSLIEHRKTSPSVSTLQQLAAALDVPITAFFEMEPGKRSVSCLKAGRRAKTAFRFGTLEDLGAGLTVRGGLPLLISLDPHASSGSTPIVHTGIEFVFCLEGQLLYTVENQAYMLDPGDSLIFEAHLPHCWQNTGETVSRSLLIMCPTDESDYPAKRHFQTV